MYSHNLRARIYQTCKAVERDQKRINAGLPVDAKLGRYAKL